MKYHRGVIALLMLVFLVSQPVNVGVAAPASDILPPYSIEISFTNTGADLMPVPDESLPIDLHLPLDPHTGKAPRFRLPDLQTLPPFDLRIRGTSGGHRELRLGNTIWNSGKGKLELIGELNPLTRQTIVLQRISASDGSAHARRVGEFVFHPTHDHWHFDGFAVYELWSLAPDGRLDRMITSSDKISYCLIDTDPLERSMVQFSPRRGYGGCGRRTQGLSPGWGDTYKSSLDGQSLDITGVADGFYALVSTTNPDRYLYESDYSNNSALVYIEIRLNRVIKLQRSEIIHRRCLQLAIC